MTPTEPVEPSPAHSMWVGIGEAIHAKIGDKITAARTDATAGMLERIEQELVPLVRPIAKQILEDPDTPAEFRPIFEVLADPANFSGSIIVSFAAGAMLSPVLSAWTAPIVQVVANKAWQGDVGNANAFGGIPLSPAVLAEMVLKGVTLGSPGIPAAAALAAEAAMSGITSTRFDAMTQAAGQSLGLEEALLLERRGKLAPLTLNDVLAYSNMNPKFYEAAANLVYFPPSPAEVITGVLKHHLTDITQAKQYFSESGLDPTLHWDWMLATAGRPLGLMEMIGLYRRGYATQADLQANVEQSDINPAWLKFILAPDGTVPLAVHFPAEFQVLRLLQTGAMLPARARQILEWEGYQDVDITALLTEYNTHKTAKTKELTQSQIVASYEARLITAPVALARLEALTYTAADAQDLLDLADEKRSLALQHAAITKIRAEYVASHITLAEATTALGAALVPTLAQHDLITFWDVERSVNIHHPTPAQVIHAYRLNVIGAADAKARLTKLGVAAGDLAVVVAAGYPPTHPAPAQAAVAAITAA